MKKIMLLTTFISSCAADPKFCEAPEVRVLVDHAVTCELACDPDYGPSWCPAETHVAADPSNICWCAPDFSRSSHGE